MFFCAINSRFYSEQKIKGSKAYNALKNKISIHDIILLNSNIKKDNFLLARKNDIHLLKLARKNHDGTLKKYLYEFKKSSGHERRFYNFKKWYKKIK